MNKTLPDSIEDAVGLIIQLKSKDKFSIDNFGKDSKYVFLLQDIKGNEWKTDNDRIRVYPLEQYAKPHAQVHLLFTIMGYQSIKEKFMVVDKVRFSVGMAM